MKNKVSFNDLYFGVQTCGLVGKDFEPINVFQSIRVKDSVASWITMSPKRKEEISDPLFYCFGDTWGRIEWEFGVTPPFWDGDSKKVNVYDFFIKPNEKLLMDMIDRVTLNSAKEYYKKRKAEQKRNREALRKYMQEELGS